jgi:hypothetical protein
MQPAHFRRDQDRARVGRRRPAVRRVLGQCEVRAAPMVIGQIRVKDATEVPLIEDDDVVETLAPNGPDDALDERILPWTDRTRHDFGDAQAGDPATHRLVVDAIAVSQEPSWDGVLGKCFDQLLRRPRGGRMLAAVDVHDPAAIVGDQDEHEEDAAGQRRDREEIH